MKIEQRNVDKKFDFFEKLQNCDKVVVTVKDFFYTSFYLSPLLLLFASLTRVEKVVSYNKELKSIQ